MSDSLSMPEPLPVNPLRNPTYPQRVHIRERAQWQAVLKTWEDRIMAAKASIKTPGAAADKLLAQMSGARDQIAAAVKRLPMEVTEMYEEDRHRVEEAIASLERLLERGKTQGVLA